LWGLLHRSERRSCLANRGAPLLAHTAHLPLGAGVGHGRTLTPHRKVSVRRTSSGAGNPPSGLVSRRSQSDQEDIRRGGVVGQIPLM